MSDQNFGSFARSDRVAAEIVGLESDGSIHVRAVISGRICQRLEIPPLAGNRVRRAVAAVQAGADRQYRSWLSSRGWKTVVRAYGTDEPPTLFLAQTAPDGESFRPVRLTGDGVEALRRACDWQEAHTYMRGRAAS